MGKFPGADSLLEDWVWEPGRLGARSRPSSVFETVEAVAEVHLTGGRWQLFVNIGACRLATLEWTVATHLNMVSPGSHLKILQDTIAHVPVQWQSF